MLSINPSFGPNINESLNSQQISNRPAFQLLQGGGSMSAERCITKPFWGLSPSGVPGSGQPFSQISDSLGQIAQMMGGIRDTITGITERLSGVLPAPTQIGGSNAPGVSPESTNTTPVNPNVPSQISGQPGALDNFISKFSEVISGLKDVMNKFTTVPEQGIGKSGSGNNILKNVTSLIGSFVGFSPSKSAKLFKSFQDVFKGFLQK